MNVYNGKDYAYPVESFHCGGLMYNTEIAERRQGITETRRPLMNFWRIMDKMKANGLEYPFIVPQRTAPGATGFVFCYLIK